MKALSGMKRKEGQKKQKRKPEKGKSFHSGNVLRRSA